MFDDSFIALLSDSACYFYNSTAFLCPPRQLVLWSWLPGRGYYEKHGTKHMIDRKNNTLRDSEGGVAHRSTKAEGRETKGGIQHPNMRGCSQMGTCDLYTREHFTAIWWRLMPVQQCNTASQALETDPNSLLTDTDSTHPHRPFSRRRTYSARAS